MTLSKNAMVSEIGRRTRLRNRDVQRIDRGERRGMLSSGEPRRVMHRLVVRPSKQLREKLRKL